MSAECLGSSPDILLDEEGIIRQIEVSEAVRTTCKRAQYDVEEFYKKYKLFGLCRYDFVDEVPALAPVQDASGNAVAFYDPIRASLSKVEELTDEEKRAGVITRTIPSDGGNFKVYFKNKYGVWVHPMTEM